MSETELSPSHKSRPRRTLELTDAEHAALVHIRDHDPRPCQREKAAALLKIARGQTPHQVARHALLKPRDPDTVYSWLDWYQQHRTLPVRPATGGRAFSPRRLRHGAGDDPADAPKRGRAS